MSHIFEYEIPICNLKRLIEQDSSDNFRIVVNIQNPDISDSNAKQAIICTSKNKARVISKKINDLFQIDPTLEEYIFNLPPISNSKQSNSNQTTKIKEIIRNIISSIDNKISVPIDQKQLFSAILDLLGQFGDNNISNLKNLRSEFSTQEEAISYLNTEFHSNSIEYLSSHFKELVLKSQNKNISKDILYEIIDHYVENRQKSIEKDKKDDIIEIFKAMKNSNEEPTVLMHFLISIDPIEYNDEIINYISENIIDEIIANEMSGFLHLLKYHLIELNQYKQIEKKQGNQRIECQFKNKLFQGIIECLKEKENTQNPIKITAGGSNNPSFPPTNLIKYDDNNLNRKFYNYFSSVPSKSDGWIEFDFVDKKINVNSYSIRTNMEHPNWYHPKSWKILGSNDHIQWDLIDHKVNNSELKGSYYQSRFKADNNNNNSYRYIRYTQEENWNNDREKQSNIYLTCIEFFGTIYLNN